MSARSALIRLARARVAAAALLACFAVLAAAPANAHHPQSAGTESITPKDEIAAPASADRVPVERRAYLHELTSGCPDRSPLGCCCTLICALPNGPNDVAGTGRIAITSLFPQSAHRDGLRSLPPPSPRESHAGAIGARAPPLLSA